jgi:hypothetical protein
MQHVLEKVLGDGVGQARDVEAVAAIKVCEKGLRVERCAHENDPAIRAGREPASQQNQQKISATSQLLSLKERKKGLSLRVGLEMKKNGVLIEAGESSASKHTQARNRANRSSFRRRSSVNAC